MHVIYDPDRDDNWNDFFQNQFGGSNPYFEGIPYKRGFQYGAGLGAAFAATIPFLIPLARRVGQQLGRETLDFGSRVLSQLSEGEALKQTLKKEGRQSAKNLFNKTKTAFQNGEGRRRRRHPNKSNHSLIGKRLKTAAKLQRSLDHQPSPRDPFEQ